MWLPKIPFFSKKHVFEPVERVSSLEVKKVGPTSSVVRGPFTKGPDSPLYKMPTYYSVNNSIKMYANGSGLFSESMSIALKNEHKAAVEFLLSKIFYNLHLSDSYSEKKLFKKRRDYSLEPNHQVAEMSFEEFYNKYEAKAKEAIAEIVILVLLFGNSDRGVNSHNIKYYSDGTFLIYDYVIAKDLRIKPDYKILFTGYNVGRLADIDWRHDREIVDIILHKLDVLRKYLRSNEGLEIYKFATSEMGMKFGPVEDVFFKYSQKNHLNSVADLYWLILDRIEEAIEFVLKRSP